MSVPNRLPSGRAFIRWHGGKARIAPLIIPQMPPHLIYTEAFGGGFGVGMQKPPAATDVYNDLNHDVWNVFKQMREAGPRLRELLELTPFSREEYLFCYEPTVDPMEAARRFIFRSAAGVGGDSSRRQNGFRTGLNCESQSSAGTWEKMRELWPIVIERLRHVLIECKPAVEVLQGFDTAKTLHFIDPPYPWSTRKAKHRQYTHEMSDEDHVALAAVVHGLKGMSIVCSYDNRLYRRLYKGWRRMEIDNRDNSNGARKDVLWFSPNLPAMEPELFPTEPPSDTDP